MRFPLLSVTTTSTLTTRTSITSENNSGRGLSCPQTGTAAMQKVTATAKPSLIEALPVLLGTKTVR